MRAVFSSSPSSCSPPASRLPAENFWKGCDHCGQKGDGNEQMKHQVQARGNLITSSSSSPTEGSSSPRRTARGGKSWVRVLGNHLGPPPGFVREPGLPLWTRCPVGLGLGCRSGSTWHGESMPFPERWM